MTLTGYWTVPNRGMTLDAFLKMACPLIAFRLNTLLSQTSPLPGLQNMHERVQWPAPLPHKIPRGHLTRTASSLASLWRLQPGARTRFGKLIAQRVAITGAAKVQILQDCAALSIELLCTYRTQLMFSFSGSGKPYLASAHVPSHIRIPK